jgi:hypothetical protein
MSQCLSESDTTAPMPATQCIPKGCISKRCWVIHLCESGGGQLRAILHPSGMLWFSGVVRWCRYAQPPAFALGCLRHLIAQCRF